MAEIEKNTKGTTATLEKEKSSVPSHIGIIMDGNRRWAEKRGRNSAFGHREGYKRLKEVSDFCRDAGINILTIYAMSSENIKERSKEELKELFDLLRVGVRKEGKFLDRDNVRMKFIGRREGLPQDLIADIEKVEERTKNNTGGIFNVALNYGGRAEIVDALKNIIKKNVHPKNITEETVSENLYTEGQEEPGLIIRSGGRKRLSNFLLWQATYAECYFTDALWPDFNVEEFKKALDFYRNTQRNFGA